MKKIFLFTLTAVMAATFASCSKDDEPSDYENTYDGVSIYLNAVETLYIHDGADEGKPAFTPTSEPGVYVAAAESPEDAYSFIVRLIENDKWDGKDVTISLGENGESGSLKIIGQSATLLSNGIYNEVIVDIVDYQPYTLEILTAQNGENGYGHDIVVVK